ncbi:MAG: trigger factor [Arenicella sp.]
MQVSVEKTGDIARKLTVVVPNERLATESETRLRKLAKTVKIDGFRPGKVPFKVVQKRYSDSVHYEVVQQVIDQTLREALEQEKVVPAAVPDVTPTAMEPGKDLEYTADFDVYPTFSKLDLKGVKVKTAEASVDAKDVDRTLDSMRKQHIDWKEVKRKAKKEDRVLIDFVGSIDGEEFAGGSAEQFPVILGEGQMLPEFEKGLTGVKGGEEATVEVNFPEDYQGEEVAGKTAQFAITVHSVSAPELPEVNEEFAKKFNIDSVDALRADIEKNLNLNVESQLNNLNRTRVLNSVLEQNSTEVPRKMIHEEIHRMIESQKEQMTQRGMDASQFNPSHDEFEPEARKRVGLGLIMMEIISNDKIVVDPAKVKDYIEKMAGSYEKPQEFIDWYYADKSRLQQVESVVLEGQVVDHLLASATTSKESVDIEELLQGTIK